MNRPDFVGAWAEARGQWAANLRLRAGLWLALGIVWIYALQLLSDSVDAARGASAALTEEISRLKPLARDNAWPARVDEARQQLAALHSMQWPEADVGLAEAAFQDWVRATAAAAGLRVRELSLARSATASGAPEALREAEGQSIKLRMNVELGRNELLAFLSEVGHQQRVVVVDRLALNLASPVGNAEIDLRMRSAAPATAPGGPR